MKRLGILLLGAVLFAGQPLSAQFTPVDASRVPVDGDYVRFLGTNSGPAAYGVITGPYNGMLTSSPSTPTFTMYCVDFTHYVSTNATWAINASGGLVTGADVSQTRLGASSLIVYQQTAFLASMFASNRSNWAGIHGAMWALTGGLPSSYWNNGFTAGNVNDPDYWMAFLAGSNGIGSAAWNAFDWSSWYVMTPTVAYNANGAYTNLGNQEFLVHATPEPATYVLLLSGLIMVGFVARRRARDLGYL